MSESFKKCIGCKYSLRGHEGEFDCPECGITYDKDTKVWKSPTVLYGRGSRKPAIVFLVGALLGALALTAYFIGADRILHIVLIIMFLLSFSLQVLQFIRMRSTPPFVASTKKGLVYGYTGKAGDYCSMDWSKVHEFFHRSKTRYTTTEDLLSEIGAAIHIKDRTAFRAAVDKRIAFERKSP